MQKKIFWMVFMLLGLVADFLLPFWWACAATIPILVAAWWVAFPPFLLVRTIARRLNIQSVYYHLCGGALSGALLGYLCQRVGESLRAGDPGPPDEPGDATTLAIFGMAGAIGAFVYWWIAVRPDRAPNR